VLVRCRATKNFTVGCDQEGQLSTRKVIAQRERVRCHQSRPLHRREQLLLADQRLYGSRTLRESSSNLVGRGTRQLAPALTREPAERRAGARELGRASHGRIRARRLHPRLGVRSCEGEQEPLGPGWEASRHTPKLPRPCQLPVIGARDRVTVRIVRA